MVLFRGSRKVIYSRIKNKLSLAMFEEGRGQGCRASASLSSSSTSLSHGKSH